MKTVVILLLNTCMLQKHHAGALVLMRMEQGRWHAYPQTYHFTTITFIVTQMLAAGIQGWKVPQCYMLIGPVASKAVELPGTDQAHLQDVTC